MDKAFYCAFESRRGRSFYFFETSSDFKTIFNTAIRPYTFPFPNRRPRGLMDKASDFESEDCAFESRRGRSFYFFPNIFILYFSLNFVFPFAKYVLTR